MDLVEEKPPTSKQYGRWLGAPNKSNPEYSQFIVEDTCASLTDKSLQTLLTKVEAIVNSRPLTTDVINDDTSLVPLSPINLGTMKSRVVMPPPDIFTSADIYCRKHWRRVQHLAMNSGVGGGKRYY